MEGQKKSNKGWMKWHFLESNSSKRGPWFAKNTILHDVNVSSDETSAL